MLKYAKLWFSGELQCGSPWKLILWNTAQEEKKWVNVTTKTPTIIPLPPVSQPCHPLPYFRPPINPFMPLDLIALNPFVPLKEREKEKDLPSPLSLSQMLLLARRDYYGHDKSLSPRLRSAVSNSRDAISIPFSCSVGTDFVDLSIQICHPKSFLRSWEVSTYARKHVSWTEEGNQSRWKILALHAWKPTTAFKWNIWCRVQAFYIVVSIALLQVRNPQIEFCTLTCAFPLPSFMFGCR